MGRPAPIRVGIIEVYSASRSGCPGTLDPSRELDLCSVPDRVTPEQL